jgi:hypothetical protein
MSIAYQIVLLSKYSMFQPFKAVRSALINLRTLLSRCAVKDYGQWMIECSLPISLKIPVNNNIELAILKRSLCPTLGGGIKPSLTSYNNSQNEYCSQ